MNPTHRPLSWIKSKHLFVSIARGNGNTKIFQCAVPLARRLLQKESPGDLQHCARGLFMKSRRLVLQGALVGATLALSASLAYAEPLKVGILIPGSKSDKGWMESSYDGLMAAEKKYGDKVQVQMIEN